ncbi:transcriptional regulator, TetR family [Desulfonispora thiosulfatigenes DSM 11270]|uniref:Transcriptional regulator, TetR family n=1 Tax=Desulfonispora thiosulfatigenes DSM 11270 TaxID=656914 RepID=A0A1W1UD54_DESTI|nr:TetR/AcrR family transcriptional regulator [Desulfonispora thiosulfatigenes]SMB78980.1 transcriptional regulator, TetR family [Desulfonispora thiosulfatigenes DSM 11270]
MQNLSDNALSILLQQYLETEKNLTEKQKNILKAAVAVFSEKGFAGASTSEIAQKAGVAEGTIFRHYKTKKALLFSIVSPTIVGLGAPIVLKDFESILEKQYVDFADFLRTIIKDRFEFIKNNQAILKIIANEISFHLELQQMVKEILTTRIMTKIQLAIEYFQEQGEIVLLPYETIARLIFSTIAGYAVTRFLISPNQDWNDEQEIETMIEFLVKGLKT